MLKNCTQWTFFFTNSKHSECFPDVDAAPPTTKPGTNSKEQTVDSTADAIDLDAEEQQVLQISDDDFQGGNQRSTQRVMVQPRTIAARFVFEPPETALMTLCGHVFVVHAYFKWLIAQEHVNNSAIALFVEVKCT
ncbi:CFC_HP_G0089500.mRNA.1.CDS.1 [Saccharomyces cerevisiae]|nr:CFC_HP_G0089500.mRNA.1.CDS.1 [Saccharomyces cerevisiae]CAI6839035.1 CFC_HP_G0089500.mRNA.1.CDS.1 [Saccharomyces cerevisiae]